MPGSRIFCTTAWSVTGWTGKTRAHPFADRMSPPVPPLNSASVQRYTDGQLKWIIDHGISPSRMPASKGILGDEEMWQIVDYIRHCRRKAASGSQRSMEINSGADAETCDR